MRPVAANSLSDHAVSAQQTTLAGNGNNSGSSSLLCLPSEPRPRGKDGDESAGASGPSQVGSVAGDRADKGSAHSTAIDDADSPRKPFRPPPVTGQLERKRAYDSALWHDDLLGPVAPGRQQHISASAPAASRPLPAAVSPSSFGQTLSAHTLSDPSQMSAATASAPRASSALHLVGLSEDPKSPAAAFSPLSPHVEPFAPSRPRAMINTLSTGASGTALSGPLRQVSRDCIPFHFLSADWSDLIRTGHLASQSSDGSDGAFALERAAPAYRDRRAVPRVLGSIFRHWVRLASW